MEERNAPLFACPQHGFFSVFFPLKKVDKICFTSFSPIHHFVALRLMKLKDAFKFFRESFALQYVLILQHNVRQQNLIAPTLYCAQGYVNL